MRNISQGRSVHLLDVENLVGAPRPATSDVVTMMDHYRKRVPASGMDQYVAAVNHGALVTVGLALAGIQILVRSGRDGADEALCEVIRFDHLDDRFERVIIGSGDGIFTELADWLRRRGVQVVVVSRPDALSYRLRRTAGQVIPLDLAA
ncbi:NYN domain-containing protein [Planomonospora sp. ID67723]|uniref:NYN domain-containing protein n=1 Tax=Planomonospora sp. ID67723 TaxID=2738134 RepID=UPI0018C3F9AE|nr:NYN domain-containing protein [Planomonospora sp. ID67723]MBG0830366.1 NYN domain-containing protein [Planomonospora sp. ID67723]